MKITTRRVVILLMVLLSDLCLYGQHKYSFVPVTGDFTQASYTIKLNPSNITVTMSNNIQTLELAVRITSIEVYDGSNRSFQDWEANSLMMGGGWNPHFFMIYWDPQIELSVTRIDNTTSLAGDTIGSDEGIVVHAKRNGYTGPIPLYISQTTTVTEGSPKLMDIYAPSDTFIADNHWGTFISLFGTDRNILTKGFYLRSFFSINLNPLPNSYVYSTPAGLVYLKDGMSAVPSENLLSLCGDLQLTPHHIVPPYTVKTTQSNVTKTFAYNTSPVILNNDTIKAHGFSPDIPMAITLKSVTYNDMVTKTIPVTFLSPVDTTGKKITSTPQSCAANSDGTIIVSIPNKNDTCMLYCWITGSEISYEGETNNSHIDFNTVVAGTYQIKLQYKYNNVFVGCLIDIGTIEVGLRSKLTITGITETKTQTCSYTNDAALTVTTTGGVPGNIDYFIGADRYDDIIGNLSGGVPYSIRAIDSKDCMSDAVSKTTTAIPPLNISLTRGDSIACYSDLAEAALSASGGNGEYKFSIDGGSPQVPGTFYFSGNQHKINHTIELTDKNGCEKAINATFTEPPELMFLPTPYTARNLQCNNDNSGSVILHGTGGTGIIQGNLYDSFNQLYNRSNDTSFTGLSALTYKAFLFDANGCRTDTLKNITLTEPDGITFSNIDSTLETCIDTKDASITLNVSANAESFQWYQGSDSIVDKTSRDLIGVGSGTYRLKATYNSGVCSSLSRFIPIQPKPQIDFSFTSHQSCADGAGGGELRLTNVNNGTAPYTYVFNNGAEQNTGTYPVIFNNLAEGDYPLEVRDANYSRGGIYASQCKASNTITISPKNSALITPSVTEPLCFGDSNGSISVYQLTGPDNPFVHAWLNANGDTIGTGNLLATIPAGEYSAVINDSCNCRIKQTGFTVDQPIKLTYNNVAIEDASCEEINDGSINITALGGTGAYQYSNNAGFTWQTNPTMPNMASGSYHLQTRDDNACAIDTNILVGAFNPALSEYAYNSISCFGEADGSLTFKADNSKSDGFVYYLYANGYDASNATGIFNNLDNRLYMSYARDSKNCYTDTLTRQIYEPNLLNVQLFLKDSAACGQPIGKIGYAISGGNGQYNLLWYNSAIGDTPELDTNALKTGNYTLTVNDLKGCEASEVINVPDRPAPVITGITETTKTWCDLSLGSARADVTGGSPQYTYLWDNADADITAVADSLKEGTYHVIVTDRYNCTDEAQITLTDGPPVSLTSNVEDPHCGQNDGSVELSVTGGVYPFMFQWPDSVSAVPVSDSAMDNLYAGVYPVKVSDNVGCVKEFSVSLTDLDGPSIDRLDVTKAWCGLSRGTAEVAVTKGSEPYSYMWRPVSTSVNLGDASLVTGLKAGDYLVMITDLNNCKAVKNFNITDSVELQPLLSLASLDSAACNKPLGKLSVAMSKGLAPYTYQWNNGAVTDSLINIARGTYRVTATDQRGCRDSLELQLPDRKAPVVYLLSKESAYCGKPSGSVTVYASLGRAPYQAYLTTEPADKTPLPFNISQHRYMGTIDSLLPLPTAYRVKLSDANGCESPEIGVLINDNNPLSFNLTDIAPVSCYGLSDGKAIVTAANGFEPYTYEWNTNTVNNSTNSSLPAGPFSVKVTDAKECTKTLYVTATPITQPPPVSVSSEYITQPSCSGICNGTITAIATGGNGNYTYIWNNADTVQSGTNLCSGANVLKITDAKGCNLISTYTLINPAPLTGTNLPDSATVCSGQHYFANPGSEWANVSWASDNSYTSTNHIADITAQGVYYMSGYSEKGCKVTDTIRVIISDDLLDAQFLMMSQAYAGDTVVIIEVSWPVADEYQWDLPKSATLVYDNANYKELIFNEPGNYYVQLTARLAGCSSVSGKYIEVLDVYENQDAQVQPQEDPPLIKSFGIYPNPANMDFNVDVKLTEESAIRVEIINVNGGSLNRVLNDYGLDNYLVNVNIDGLMPGTYVVRLIAGNESKTKILIVK